MHPTLVILVVGLSPSLVGEHTPNLQKLVRRGGLRPMKAITPAVTCSAQSTLLTGTLPAEHGIVANGWYFRDLSEVWLWRQSNKLVAGEKIWETAKKLDSGFTCAKMFWWYNMYSTADWSATPRPMYPADGRKIPDHSVIPPSYTMSWTRSSVSFHCLSSGGLQRILLPVNGFLMPLCT